MVVVVVVVVVALADLDVKDGWSLRIRSLALQRPLLSLHLCLMQELVLPSSHQLIFKTSMKINSVICFFNSLPRILHLLWVKFTLRASKLNNHQLVNPTCLKPSYQVQLLFQSLKLHWPETGKPLWGPTSFFNKLVSIYLHLNKIYQQGWRPLSNFTQPEHNTRHPDLPYLLWLPPHLLLLSHRLFSSGFRAQSMHHTHKSNAGQPPFSCPTTFQCQIQRSSTAW